MQLQRLRGRSASASCTSGRFFPVDHAKTPTQPSHPPNPEHFAHAATALTDFTHSHFPRPTFHPSRLPTNLPAQLPNHYVPHAAPAGSLLQQLPGAQGVCRARSASSVQLPPVRCVRHLRDDERRHTADVEAGVRVRLRGCLGGEGNRRVRCGLERGDSRCASRSSSILPRRTASGSTFGRTASAVSGSALGHTASGSAPRPRTRARQPAGEAPGFRSAG